MNRLFTASLPFWRTATSETFVLHVTGLTSPGQPPVTGLGAASPHLTLVNCPPQVRACPRPGCGDAPLGEDPFLPTFSAHRGRPVGGRGDILLWAQGEGLAWGARILAEAVRWSGFSCNCRGDFPVVFRPWPSHSRSRCCRRITGTAVAATPCPSWAAGAFWRGSARSLSLQRCFGQKM